MASRLNAKVHNFIARSRDPKAIGVDALISPWHQFQLPYVFPPLPLLPKVIRKIKTGGSGHSGRSGLASSRLQAQVLAVTAASCDLLLPPLHPQPEQLEDLSDAAYSASHAKCEEMERTRWVSSSIPPQRRGSRTHRTSESSLSAQPLTPQPPSPDTSSWQALPDFSPLSPDVLSAPPTPTSRDTPRLISEETQSSVSDSGFEEMTVQPWERRHFPLPYQPKQDLAGTSEPTDWGGPRPPRRSSCSSRTAKDTEGPPSSPPCPSTRPRPLHR
ncbi:unnamed protein product [Ranitomeya imitator]|uniref:PEHE domain-containing protein n=1 Tax=Ranitomeya imitator TaxID=111125 RepID=A0ABN9KWJ9_9NEOB|nr:unnamed protein product [Ranitomeya imitator]